MNKERAKEILIKYKEKTDLFNWCDEYNQFMQNNVYCLMNEEAEYMLKKSLEDSESPLSYDDFNASYIETESLIYDLLQEFKDFSEEDKKEFLELLGLEYYKIFKGEELIKELETFLESKDEDELKRIIEDDLNHVTNLDFYDYERQREIFQWFIVSQDLAHDIQQEGGVILNCNWFGRECCGQSLTLDYMFMKIYINRLKNWFTEEELKDFGY